MKQFTETPEISKLLDHISEKGLDSKIYSDLADSEGNQYVDLVQEGGGVLGIALAGYTWILEKCGIRFFSLAGTSAGAINTMMIAGLGEIGKPVSGKILDILSKQDLSEFIDGDRRIQKLIRIYVEDKPCFKFFVFLNAFRIWRILKKNLGINPGEEFEKWLSGCLKESGIMTLKDLRQLRSRIPVLYDRSDNNAEITRMPGLQIIASDLTTKSKIVFPEMAELYWEDPDSINPARFVRASMSIPYFFYPFKVDNIPNAGETESPSLPKSQTKWSRHVGYYGKIPDRVYFVDGGLLSNFPINAFHLGSGVPKKPTFGVKLSAWRESYTITETPGNMSSAMVSTMRQLHDYDFLLRNPDYNSLICYIDADTEFNWLNFDMTPEKQVALFLRGAEKAVSFLEKFNWEEYKKLRQKN
ncbi:MAG: patatin-like phospholipase family protein [Bacteroidales bacterium]